MPSLSRRQIIAAWGIIALLVCLAYSNHFQNSFQFDDYHTVEQNPWIRDLANIPKFFIDAHTFSIYPLDQIYRPLTTTSLALDYYFAGGLRPLAFHVSTFCWFLVLLACLIVLYWKTLDAAQPDPRNIWVALFGTALFGLHPAMPETINYILQRGDLYSTLGIVAGLVVYIAAPDLRRYGLYLIPALLGLFSKEPAAVFPAVLFVWVWLFEERSFLKAVLRCVPAGVVIGAGALFIISMEPPSYNPGAASALAYRISQPAVLLTYFRKFFITTGLSGDTDRAPYTSIAQPEAMLGFLFVALMIAAIFWCARRQELRPISFGLAWFLIVSLPTSLVGLAEVENDHRMFFPFVGLTLSVCWAAALWLRRSPVPRNAVAVACGLILLAGGLSAHERNKVWRTKEAFWLDVTVKSPKNGRALMNYGLAQMEAGRYSIALEYFERALTYTPNYPTLETNLGIVNGAMGRTSEAERHFNRSIELGGSDGAPYFFYGRWLNQVGRVREAAIILKRAIEKNTALLDARHLLMAVYLYQRDAASLRALASDTIANFPQDPEARVWLAKADGVAAGAPAMAATTPEEWINESLALYQAGKFRESIHAAQEALKLRPDYPEAWNNIMAGYNSLGDWDKAIEAGENAVKLKPDFERARNNLAWARSHKGPGR